jgi:hypothetical protein
MFECPSDHGFAQEARSVRRTVRVTGLDLLERDLSVQLLVQGEVDLAETTPGMGANNVKPEIGRNGHLSGLAPPANGTDHLMGLAETESDRI